MNNLDCVEETPSEVFPQVELLILPKRRSVPSELSLLRHHHHRSSSEETFRPIWMKACHPLSSWSLSSLSHIGFHCYHHNPHLLPEPPFGHHIRYHRWLWLLLLSIYLSQPLDRLNLVGRLMATLHWFLTACWWNALTRRKDINVWNQISSVKLIRFSLRAGGKPWQENISRLNCVFLGFSLHDVGENLGHTMSLFSSENLAVISIIGIQSALC